MEKTYITPDIKVKNVNIKPCMQNVSLVQQKANNNYNGGGGGNNDAKCIYNFIYDDTDL